MLIGIIYAVTGPRGEFFEDLFGPPLWATGLYGVLIVAKVFSKIVKAR